MRRLLYILPLFLICTAGYGQTTYDLSYSAQALDSKTGNSLDSVRMGDYFNMEVIATNHSSTAFPRTNIYLNRSVGKGLDNSTKLKGHLSVDTLLFNAMPDFGYSSSSRKSIHVTTHDFVLGDNVVIIWPSGGISDNNKDRVDTGLNYITTFKVHVYGPEDKSGLNEIATGSIGMTVYPNPANSSATINVNGVHNGVLTITDISGKILMALPVRGDGNAMNISLPLNINGNALAEGLYFVNLTTENAHCVQKLLISK